MHCSPGGGRGDLGNRGKQINYPPLRWLVPSSSASGLEGRVKPNYPPRSGRSTAWRFEGKAQTFLLLFFFNIFIKIKMKIVIQRQTKGCK